jgi:hypothetical protein
VQKVYFVEQFILLYISSTRVLFVKGTLGKTFFLSQHSLAKILHSAATLIVRRLPLSSNERREREHCAEKHRVLAPTKTPIQAVRPHGSKRRALSSGFCTRTEREKGSQKKQKRNEQTNSLDWGRASKQLWRFPIWWWHCSGHVLWMPLCVHSNVCYPFTAKLIYQSYSPATRCCELPALLNP